MLTEEDARRLVLAEIDDVRGHVTYDLQILRVEALPFGWIFYWGGSLGEAERTAPSVGRQRSFPGGP
ncbi:hypothetical protein QFZ22_004796 [Streptomyces canus]|uniref:Immunity protein 35 domain-containing protein n=1 Tax=Streptomyces canus TaxID=58343 RepID=A0AAW8FF94_9ACTN|nr:hypothetical protein [Streptomyces canus]MDQ0908811.1 hypothetical protein [Streptomyces canus]